MRTNSSKENIEKNIGKVQSKLKAIDIEEISKESGFTRRERKISSKGLIVGYILMFFGSQSKTFETWAEKIALYLKTSISKQAVFKKIANKNYEEFLKNVVFKLISYKASKSFNKPKAFTGEIYTQDSTCLTLDASLAKDYPGNKTSNEQKSQAQMKIDVIFGILREGVKKITIGSFRQNDQSRAYEILKVAKAGDIILRDLGYSVLKAFKEMAELGIYFVSLLNSTIKLYEVEDQKEINLLKLLRGKEVLDKDVIVGKDKVFQARLICKKLENSQIEKKKRHAEKENKKHKRVNHTKEYFELLEWEIIITNLPRESFSVIEVLELYRLRWRIEIIFKCWKSFFKITDVIKFQSKTKVNCYIYMVLIYIVLFQSDFYLYFEDLAFSSTGEINISIMKYSKFINDNIEFFILSEILDNDFLAYFSKLVLYYCKYDKRTDRINYGLQLKFLLS